MTTPEAALKWLNKRQKQKEVSLFNATHKPNPSDREIDNLLEALDIIEYLIDLTERSIRE